jgi:hypothetical protein
MDLAKRNQKEAAGTRDENATLPRRQPFSQRFETTRALVVVGGAAVTGAIVGGLTTALPVALLYLWTEMSPYCAPWGVSARVSIVLQLAIPGVVVGTVWATMAGLITKWMANRKGGGWGLGCLGVLLVVSLFIAVAIAFMWFIWASFSICQ